MSLDIHARAAKHVWHDVCEYIHIPSLPFFCLCGSQPACACDSTMTCSLLACAHANVHTQMQNKQEKVSYQSMTSPPQDAFKLMKTTGETCSNSMLLDRLPSNGVESVPTGVSSWKSEVNYAKQSHQYFVSCTFVCVLPVF